MRAKNVTVYNAVYERDKTIKVSLTDFLLNPENIYHSLSRDPQEAVITAAISDKDERDYHKRSLPACDLSNSGILSIDIDGVAGNQELINITVERLKSIDSCLCIRHSISGNLVAFFRFKCKKKDYLHIYYKLYLELQLLLQIPIDYLPEINRLRYVSVGEPLYFRKKSHVLDEVIPTMVPPNFRGTIVKTKTRKKRVVFKSN